MANCEVKFVEGMTFIGKGDTNHWVAMDGAREVGGTAAGTSPMELVLIALGGCSGMDVVSILRKMRVNYDKFEMKLSGERATEHPKVFTKIHVEYTIYGKEINEKDFAHAVELSQDKYCSVAGVIKKSGVELTFSYKVISE